MANRYIRGDLEDRITLLFNRLGMDSERKRSDFINDAIREKLDKCEKEVYDAL